MLDFSITFIEQSSIKSELDKQTRMIFQQTVGNEETLIKPSPYFLSCFYDIFAGNSNKATDTLH